MPVDPRAQPPSFRTGDIPLDLGVLRQLACQVADQHALDMVTGKFLSHWGTDGRKPYHRYCRAGGFHAVQENVSAAGYLEARNLKYIGLTLAQMHMRMHEEFPPNDGHRRTILAPQHTHAGFGIALADDDLRLVELYVGKHVYLEPYPKQAKKKATLRLGGKQLNPGYLRRRLRALTGYERRDRMHYRKSTGRFGPSLQRERLTQMGSKVKSR